MEIKVTREGGIAYFPNPIGGTIVLNELPDSLRAEAQKMFVDEILNSVPKGQTQDLLIGKESQTISLTISEQGKISTYTIDESNVDLFELCNEIVNEIVRREIGSRDSNRQTKIPTIIFFDIGDTIVSDTNWMSGAKEAINELRKQGLSLGIISNTGNLSRAELSKLLPPDFSFDLFNPDLVILSSEVGVEKPNPKIFQIASERSATTPDKCVFFGEDYDEVKIASSLGFQTLLYESEESFSQLIDFAIKS